MRGECVSDTGDLDNWPLLLPRKLSCFLYTLSCFLDALSCHLDTSRHTHEAMRVFRRAELRVYGLVFRVEGLGLRS